MFGLKNFTYNKKESAQAQVSDSDSEAENCPPNGYKLTTNSIAPVRSKTVRSTTKRRKRNMAEMLVEDPAKAGPNDANCAEENSTPAAKSKKGKLC